MSTTPPISIVIRTSNSERMLARLLSRLTIGPGDEIVVVDTASRDATVSIAERAGARVVRNEEAFSYGRTLNLGFRAARHQWILALSSHCVPENSDLPDRYRAALAQLDRLPAVIYGPKLLSRVQYKQLDKRVVVHSVPEFDGVWSGGNANALYAREAWESHPFDETLISGEDWYWLKWALGEGLIFAKAPEAAIYYFHSGGPVYRFRKAYEDVRVHRLEGISGVRMPWWHLGWGIAHATRRLLFEERAVSPWIGEVAHQLGVFVATRRL